MNIPFKDENDEPIEGFVGCINCIGFHAYTNGHCGCICHERHKEKLHCKDNRCNEDGNWLK